MLEIDAVSIQVWRSGPQSIAVVRPDFRCVPSSRLPVLAAFDELRTSRWNWWLFPTIYNSSNSIMSSEIRQRQTAEVVPVVPVEPSATPPVETAVEPQHAGRRSSLLRNLLLLLLAAGALLGYQQGLFGGSEKPKVIYASR